MKFVPYTAVWNEQSIMVKKAFSKAYVPKDHSFAYITYIKCICGKTNWTCSIPSHIYENSMVYPWKIIWNNLDFSEQSATSSFLFDKFFNQCWISSIFVLHNVTFSFFPPYQWVNTCMYVNSNFSDKCRRHHPLPKIN